MKLEDARNRDKKCKGSNCEVNNLINNAYCFGTFSIGSCLVSSFFNLSFLCLGGGNGMAVSDDMLLTGTAKARKVILVAVLLKVFMVFAIDQKY